MPDILDATGLTVETASEITSALTTGLQGIYGADINVDSNSQDGQTIGIYTQGGVDVRELLVEINASFDPDQAVGIQLDQRCAINGVVRVAGTYSIFPVDITVSKTVNLQGLDSQANSATGTGFTITDGQGNNVILLDSTELTAGTTTLDCRAQAIGAVSIAINTLTTAVTVVNGVTAVNNSSAAISIGQDEETDVQLRVRRGRSVAITSTGYLNGLEAALAAITGVISAACYTNRGDTADGNGIPAHGIWCIVDGGANTDIEQCIVGKINPGTNMKGSVSVPYTSPSGQVTDILFDRPIAENLYLKFTIKTTVTGFSFNVAGIKAYIADNLSYETGAFAETSAPTASAALAINSLGGGGVPVLMQISNDGATWTDFLDTTSPQYQFTLASANINITVV
jgi:uncharacterized phage protein gp47/JayE